MSKTLAVVGGGVIGLAVAARAARDGWSVRLYDPSLGTGASWVAGGMLAPLSEGWPGEHELLELGAQSLARWPEFARALPGPSVFSATGSLTVALDAADAADLRTIAEWVGEQGHELEILGRAEVRELEPPLAQSIRLGLLARAELAVDNRALVAALRESAVGVEFVAEAVTDLDAVVADQIVLAAGAQSASLLEVPVRAVKGEILRLRRRPSAAAPPSRTIRGSVHGRAIYLVPRGDGLVVGATQHESGQDTQVTVAGVRDLIADAERLMPSIGEYELHECSAGLRPMSPDGLPVIGRVSDRVIVASGHGRNGILLTPITADAVSALLAGDTLPEAKAADPARFDEKVGTHDYRER